MKELAGSLIGMVLHAEQHLSVFSDADASRTQSAGVWTRKELLGHLIDSASNNHQRFVRMQLADKLKLFKYAQEDWVKVQHYRSADWKALIELWRAYNLHLARVIAEVPPEALGHTCTLSDSEPVTLQFVMEDYLAHMEHHLKELLKPL
jgi:DinB family protein